VANLDIRRPPVHLGADAAREREGRRWRRAAPATRDRGPGDARHRAV